MGAHSDTPKDPWFWERCDSIPTPSSPYAPYNPNPYPLGTITWNYSILQEDLDKREGASTLGGATTVNIHPPGRPMMELTVDQARYVYLKLKELFDGD